MIRLRVIIGLVGVSLAAGRASAQVHSNAHTSHCDSAFAADMDFVHEMLVHHDAIKRTVTMLPNGIRTLTESDDPAVTAFITEHVASMEERLREGRIFNVTSKSLPVIFQNRDKIRTTVEQTAKGVLVVQTSDDSVTVAALQAHALEVTELVEGGMPAMMRHMMGADRPGMMGDRGEMGAMMKGDCPMMERMRSMMHGRDSVSRGGTAARHHHRP